VFTTLLTMASCFPLVATGREDSARLALSSCAPFRIGLVSVPSFLLFRLARNAAAFCRRDVVVAGLDSTAVKRRQVRSSDAPCREDLVMTLLCLFMNWACIQSIDF
jgi:hypothetical protein